METSTIIAIVVLCIIAVTLVGIQAFKLVKQLKNDEISPDDLYERVRGWLLQAVMLAEKEFGGGTGRLKLSSVYAAFCQQCPWLAQLITFQLFAKFVDDALAEMHDLLEKNNKLADFVEDKKTTE